MASLEVLYKVCTTILADALSRRVIDVHREGA